MKRAMRVDDECPECKLERRAQATSNLHVRLFVATNPDRALCVSPMFGVLVKTQLAAQESERP